MTQRVPLAWGNVMNYERILVGNYEGIVNITINSPEHLNAIDLIVRKELNDAFSALSRDGRVRLSAQMATSIRWNESKMEILQLLQV